MAKHRDMREIVARRAVEKRVPECVDTRVGDVCVGDVISWTTERDGSGRSVVIGILPTYDPDGVRLGGDIQVLMRDGRIGLIFPDEVRSVIGVTQRLPGDWRHSASGRRLTWMSRRLSTTPTTPEQKWEVEATRLEQEYDFATDVRRREILRGRR